MSSTQRYMIENNGANKENIEFCLKEAFKICNKNSISEITLIVPKKDGFESTEIGAVFGETDARKLRSGKVLQVDNINIKLESPKTLSPYKSYGMLIGIHLSQEGQDKLDSADFADAIMFVPWTEDEGKEWMSTWDPSVLGQRTWQISPQNLHQDVVDALVIITSSINLSSGLVHPSDKNVAKQKFTDLKNAGHKPDPDEIRGWALRNNWAPMHASSLQKLAARIFK